jgi:hypothetical protein
MIKKQNLTMILQHAIQSNDVVAIAKIMVSKPTSIGFEYGDDSDDWWTNLVCEESGVCWSITKDFYDKIKREVRKEKISKLK